MIELWLYTLRKRKISSLEMNFHVWHSRKRLEFMTFVLVSIGIFIICILYIQSHISLFLTKLFRFSKYICISILLLNIFQWLINICCLSNCCWSVPLLLGSFLVLPQYWLHVVSIICITSGWQSLIEKEQDLVLCGTQPVFIQAINIFQFWWVTNKNNLRKKKFFKH